MRPMRYQQDRMFHGHRLGSLSLYSIGLWAGAGLLLGTAACGGSNTPDMAAADLTTPRDLSVSPDLTVAPDLSVSPDLTQVPDLTGADLMPATVTGLPSCTTATVTATSLYNDIVKGTCATSTSCHGPGSMIHYAISSAADIKTMWVGVKADQDPTMNRITANDVNHSYVMYKLTGEQTKVAAADVAGKQMPRSGPPYLTNDQLCEFVNWINSGAM